MTLAEIPTSLQTHKLTRVPIQSSRGIKKVTLAAHNHWISHYRSLNWRIIESSLNEHLTVIQELGPQNTTTIQYGKIKSPHTFAPLGLPHQFPYTLFVIAYDRYTQQFIFEAAEFHTQHPSSRILALEWQTLIR